MIRIAICDDNEDFRQYEYGLVNDIMYSINCVCETDFFQSGNELLTKGEQVAGYNIILLDINMPGIDGIKTAEKIREYTEEVFIVFVTSFISYALEGYKIEVTRYVLKDRCHLKNNIYEALDVILSKMRHLSKYIEYEFNVGIRKLYPEDIIYVESTLHKLTFHVNKDGEFIYSIYMKLDDVEKALSDGCMCRIHKSFLVNMRYAIHIERYSIKLYEEIQLPVAQKRFTKAKNCFYQIKGAV